MVNKITLKNGQDITFDTFDLFEFNRAIQTNATASFEVEYYSKQIKVDLVYQEIFVDDELVLKEKTLDNVRYINFRRNHLNADMKKNHGVSVVGYGFGFQGSLNGENVKRVVMIKPNGDLA